MCDLFAMSSKQPTALTFAFNELVYNGPKRRSNCDGGGIAPASDRYDGEVLLTSVLLDDQVWEALHTGTVLAVSDGYLLRQT